MHTLATTGLDLRAVSIRPKLMYSPRDSLILLAIHYPYDRCHLIQSTRIGNAA